MRRAGSNVFLHTFKPVLLFYLINSTVTLTDPGTSKASTPESSLPMTAVGRAVTKFKVGDIDYSRPINTSDDEAGVGNLLAIVAVEDG